MLEAAHLFNPSTSNLHCRCGRVIPDLYIHNISLISVLKVLTQRTNSSQYQQENPLIEQIKPISDLLRAVKDMPLPVVSKIPATPHRYGYDEHSFKHCDDEICYKIKPWVGCCACSRCCTDGSSWKSLYYSSSTKSYCTDCYL